MLLENELKPPNFSWGLRPQAPYFWPHAGQGARPFSQVLHQSNQPGEIVALISGVFWEQILLGNELKNQNLSWGLGGEGPKNNFGVLTRFQVTFVHKFCKTTE